MSSCRDVAEQATNYLERRLTLRRRLGLLLHLLACPPCVRYVDQMKKTVKLVGAMPREKPEPEVEDKLLNAFRNKAAAAKGPQKPG
jgi:Putative zinc-finger